MINLYGYTLEIYQVILLVYVIGYGIVLGVSNTFWRFVSLFGGEYQQSDFGKIMDALWYGCIFVLVGMLV